MAFPEPLERLIRAFERLPGIGARSAERMALHVLRTPPDEVAALAVALRDARMETRRCEQCRNVTLSSPCEICSDEERDAGILCVVEGPREVEKLESSGAHRGVYHVLLEGFAPREGAEPDPGSLAALRRRAESGELREVVIATAPDREGEGAALLVSEALAGTQVRVSRLARGVPVGTPLEYLHGEVLAEAFRERRPWQGGESGRGRGPE